MLLEIVSKIKNVPDIWIICLTILILPLSSGLSLKIARTDFISFNNGNTQIELSEVINKNDELINELESTNLDLMRANNQVIKIAKKKNIEIPELKAVQSVIDDGDRIVEELKDNNQELENVDF